VVVLYLRELTEMREKDIGRRGKNRREWRRPEGGRREEG
jgi:hypothetical protein